MYMEEPKYEYDWRHPIEVPNSKNKCGVSKEKRSFKWFQYWLKHGCNYKQIADYFKTSEKSVQVIASLFKWHERKCNKEDYDSRQREQLQQQRYQEFIDNDYNNAKTQMNALYTLSQIALIFLGVLPDNGNLEIPKDMTIKEATRILQGNPNAINKMHNQILRDLEKAPIINDKEKIELENTTIKLNTDLSRLSEIDDIYENRFKDFINKTLGTDD